eukprot:11213461-Lingulodinium_polyedra.AAC.1
MRAYVARVTGWGPTGAPANGNGHGLSGAGPRTTGAPGGGNGHGLSEAASCTNGNHQEIGPSKTVNDTA